MSDRAEWAKDEQPNDDPVLAHEVSERFMKLMRNAMGISYYVYGPAAAGFPEKVNALKSLQLRLQKYRQTGNVEYLVDAANFAMIEFMHPAHPKAHYAPTDTGASPGRTSRREDIYDRPHRLRNQDIEE